MSDFDKVKTLLEEQGRDWQEYKRENDQRLKALEASKGTADFDQKLASMDQSMQRTAEQLKQIDSEKQAREALEQRLDAIELKGGRLGATAATAREAEEYRGAYTAFMRKGDERAIEALQTKAGNVATDSEGGYAVPDGLDTTVLQLLRDSNPMRQVATVMQVSNEAYRQIVNVNGAAGGWVGETDARPQTDSPKLDEFKPAFGELYANPAATQKLLDDAFFDIEMWYASEIAQTFAEKEGDSFVNGNGTNKPKGLLAYTTAATDDKTRAYGTLQHIATAAAGSITYDDLISISYALRAGYRQKAAWMLNSTALSSVRKLKDDQGNYIWQPSQQAGQPSMLAGFAVVENEDMPAVASGALPIAFGDFKRAYRILDVRGIRTLRDPYTNKPYVHFYTTKRVGGGVADTRAVKLLKVG